VCLYIETLSIYSSGVDRAVSWDVAGKGKDVENEKSKMSRGGNGVEVFTSQPIKALEASL